MEKLKFGKNLLNKSFVPTDKLNNKIITILNQPDYDGDQGSDGNGDSAGDFH